jgi:hypothetical protein
MRRRAKSLAMSTDYPDSAASVNIGAVSYRCTESGCKNPTRMPMITPRPATGR